MKSINDLTEDEFAGLVKAAVHLPDAPPAAVRAAVGLWKEKPASLMQVAEGAVDRILAVLSFDSWTASPASLGLRSAQSTESRHLMFSSPGRDIDLRVLSAEGSFVLAGQILGPDERGSVEISVNTEQNNPKIIRSAPLDDLGGFHLDNLRAGTYWMTLRMNGDDIVLPAIVVGPPGH